MADLQDLLSSISDEDMAKIKSVAESIMNGSEKGGAKQSADTASGSAPSDGDMMAKLMSAMGQNHEDSRTRLINDLKPLLSEERRQRADEALRFMRLMEMMPLLKGMFGQ